VAPVSSGDSGGAVTDRATAPVPPATFRFKPGACRIRIPPAADGTLNITVTLTVSETKQMTVKTTVDETASTQQLGPFTVE
jgi:hypothetical protein